MSMNPFAGTNQIVACERDHADEESPATIVESGQIFWRLSDAATDTQLAKSNHGVRQVGLFQPPDFFDAKFDGKRRHCIIKMLRLGSPDNGRGHD